MYWKVPNIWEGGKCFIIGGGNSMTEQFNIPQEVVDKVMMGINPLSTYSPYLSFLHDKHVIAVNEAFKLGSWIDVLFWGDDNYYKTRKTEILGFEGLRVTCMNEQIMSQKIKNLKRHSFKKNNDPLIGVSEDVSKVAWNIHKGNSGSAAINLAVHFGVKEIYLIGFDMNLDANNNQHWHNSYHTNITTVGGTFKRHLSNFPQIAEDLNRLGIKCINLNPKSAINDFEKMTVTDLINNYNG
jgi:hypothetical protein